MKIFVVLVRYLSMEFCLFDEKGAFCVLCQYGQSSSLFKTFAKRGEIAFTIHGFGNWKKAVERFAKYERSDAYRTAMRKRLS